MTGPPSTGLRLLDRLISHGISLIKRLRWTSPIALAGLLYTSPVCNTSFMTPYSCSDLQAAHHNPIVSAGHENIVQELIGAGADVNRWVLFHFFCLTVFEETFSQKERQRPDTTVSRMLRPHQSLCFYPRFILYVDTMQRQSLALTCVCCHFGVH